MTFGHRSICGVGGTSIFFENNISCFKESANKRTYKITQYTGLNVHVISSLMDIAVIIHFVLL